LDYVFDNEARYANKIYLTQPQTGGATVDYTWSQVMDRARRMATYLGSQGYPAGSKIGIVSKNCAHFVMAELAIWMAGHVTVAVYPTISADTASYVIDHSDMVMLFVGKLDVWDALKKGVPDELPTIAFPLAPAGAAPAWDETVAGSEPIEGRPTRSADDMGIIIYTSGSTGKPKGVMHSFRAMSAGARGIVKALEVTSSDRCLSYLPLAHVFERAYIECASLVAGSHVFFAESLTTFAQDLQRARPTLFISVPRLWLKFQLGVFAKMPKARLDFLLKVPLVNNIIRKKVLGALGLDQVRLAGSGSAPIPAELIAWYRNLGLNLLEGYAMSEDFAYSHLSTVEHNEPGYVGVPYPEVEVRISDAQEILIKSPGAMMGYYKAPELTQESFTEDGYFKTGDRGARKPSGLLKITGRVKEIFKTSKGKYIAPAPIENLINTDAHVEASCVSGTGYPQPYAQVVIAEDLRGQLGEAAMRTRIETALGELRTSINGKVEGHEKLQFLVVISEDWSIENGMLTPTMKIRRGAIEDATKDRVEGWYEAGSPIVWA
jgi:long-subunit acyl-CoA synthetase (AMP-forming)